MHGFQGSQGQADTHINYQLVSVVEIAASCWQKIEKKEKNIFILNSFLIAFRQRL